MDIFRVSCVLGMVCNFGLTAFLATFRGKDRVEKTLFAGFTLSGGIWNLGAFMFSGFPHGEYAAAFFWMQVAYTGAIFAVLFFFHFIVLYLDLKKTALTLLIYFLGLVFLFFNWFENSRYFLGGLRFVDKFQFYWLDALAYKNPLYVFFYVSFFWVVLGYSFFLLLIALKRSIGQARNKLMYFILAVGFGWIGANPLFLQAFHIDIYPYSNFLVALYPLLVAYVIVRHKVMDLDIIIKRTLIFGSLFTITFGLFIGVTLLTQEMIAGNRYVGLGVSALVIIFAVRPLEDFLRRITDKYLFQKKYDYRHLLRTFSDEVLTMLGLEELVNMTVNKLSDIMKLESAAILLRDDGSDEFRMEASVGMDKNMPVVSDKEKLAEYMQTTGRYVLFEGMEPRTLHLWGDAEFYTNDLKAAVVIPIMYLEKLVGMLVLGKKRSDEEFTQDDMAVLLPLVRTLSIAITNARLFEKLSAAQEMAAQREKMAVIGTLSAGINHEICNPLGIARGQCEMFLLNMNEGLYKNKTHEELMLKAQEIMMKVIRETDRATSITRKLSAFAKPAKGNVRDRVDIREELKEVMALLEHDLQLDKITIFTDIENNLPAIMADKKQVQEIFFNIIRNAAQAINSSGQITIKAFSSGKNVHIDIKDTGAGINKKHLGQIFDPFFTTKEPGRGTGLGLFIVKQVVERNGGEISVQSEIGKGTTFRLVFSAAALPSG